MDLLQRLDPVDFEVAPDEELPGYEAHTAPEYRQEDFETPLLTYHLRQIDRKLKMLVPFGPSASSSYKVIARGIRLFSKKPDMEMLRTFPEHVVQDRVASIWFDNDGPLPWRPRAHFTHEDSHGQVTHWMESRNFTDWSVEIAGTTYVWTLEGRPVSLALSEKTGNVVIARFTYSRYGTLAQHGAEIGELVVYRDALSITEDGIQKMMCGLVVTIAHFKRMGRNYWNDAPVRARSLTREHLPSHRMSFASYSSR